MLKHECIWITTAGEEAFRVTALRPKFSTFSRRKFAVPRLTICVDLLTLTIVERRERIYLFIITIASRGC